MKRCLLFLGLLIVFVPAVFAEQLGGIRGMVYDKDFEAPLAAAKILIAETGKTVTSTEEGNYVFNNIKPGAYTLVFSKDGYTRQVKADVVVSPGQMTEVDASLSGEFTEMEEFIVEDVQIGSGTEALLLDLRMESPALLDSISSELMSRAGAGDAASALKLVSGATVQEGKYAVIRGLPDRYVNSQLNGIRLPTADADKRAVQLDQFPSAAIESIQVSKTFTPDQQGDASGGAVNILLKGIPDEPILKVGSQVSYNTQVAGRSDFLTYDGGGVNFLGEKTRAIPGDIITEGPSGVSYGNAPTDFKWSITAGGKHDLTPDVKIGGFGSIFYERDSSYYNNGFSNKYWIKNPGDLMTPQYSGEPPGDAWDPDNPNGNSFRTSLYDITKASQQVQWGTLGILGLETENHSLSFTYMFTRVAEDKVTLAEDTHGKYYYFPNYNVDDPMDPGNSSDGQLAAPYTRAETLEYTERTTKTFQLSGSHKLDLFDFEIGDYFKLLTPEFDWTLATSTARLYQPDKRMFNSLWVADSFVPASPWPPLPARIDPAEHRQLNAASNINFGNFHRTWKDIEEQSDQYKFDLKLPFEQWTGDEGYVKFGVFNEDLSREYDQESFANQMAGSIKYVGPWEQLWSSLYYDPALGYIETVPNALVEAANIDMDYKGQQNVSAWYWMVDLPVNSMLNFIGGVRFETTELSIITIPEDDVDLIYRDDTGDFVLDDYDPNKANVDFAQNDILPSVGFVFSPIDSLTLRGSYTETIARQTFKELSPIIQQEYLGGDVFIGNPELQMSSLKNYDLRLDWNPYEGGLVSVSYFYKDIKNPIEYVQDSVDFPFTTPVNYPEGEIRGWEVEVRQKMGELWSWMEGLSIGGNATFIDSEVTLPDDEAALLESMGFPTKTRNMMNAPERLYNFYFTYDLTPETTYGFFYTVRGDTLIAGAGNNKGFYVPDVYETQFATLNMSLTHQFSENWKFKFQVKNILNPAIKSVYRSDYLDEDVTKTSYKKGIDFSFSLSGKF